MYEFVLRTLIKAMLVARMLNVLLHYVFHENNKYTFVFHVSAQYHVSNTFTERTLV